MAGEEGGKGKMCIFYEYLCSLFVFAPPVSRRGGEKTTAVHNGGGAAYSVLGKYTEETSNNGDRIEYATDIYVLYISFATRESKINTRCIYIYIYI